MKILLFLCMITPAYAVDFWSYQSTERNICIGDTHTPGLCQTRGFVSPDLLLHLRTDGLIDNIRLWPSGNISVQFDGTVNNLRCFGQSPGDCQDDLGPGSLPRYMDLPYKPEGFIPQCCTVNGIGNDGTINRYVTKHLFYVNTVDPLNCSILATQGTIQHSTFAYLLHSLDFGGVIGIQSNVLVLEGVGGYPLPNLAPRNGERLERYYFVRGLGEIREEGFDDPQCRSGRSCVGNYTTPTPGVSVWSADTRGWSRLPLAAPCR